MGVLPFAERARLNDSINLKLEEANRKKVLVTADISKINKDLKLSDSLTYPTEIRIYTGGGITNYSSLFRMYKTEKGKWNADFYEHYDEVIGRAELKTNRKKLTAKNELEFVFKNLVRSYILELPSLDKIQWKLKKRGEINRLKYKRKGKTKVEYETMFSEVAILDGETYTIQSKTNKKSHTFTYSNPESYLKHFPEIDELIYMNEILNTLKNEFDIWKD